MVNNRITNRIIGSLKDKFDSHDFIFEFMRNFPQEYVKVLYHYVKEDDPIQSFHMEIGQILLARKDLKKLGVVQSQNSRGLSSENGEWQKI